MTIGIGVLCSTAAAHHEPRPDALVMIADTMGSTEYDSTGELHKMLYDPNNRMYSVFSGKPVIASEMTALIREEFSKIQAPRLHGSIWRALNVAVQHHRSDHFNWDVLFTRFSFNGQVLVDEKENLLADWRNYDVGAQLLLGTFDDDGRALLYYIGQVEGSLALVHLVEFPGHNALGAGCYNASVWLNYRRQNLGLSIRQSALHTFEAGLMAASAPTVNNDFEMLIAMSRGSFYLSKEHPCMDGCPISLAELTSLAKKYGPRRTDALGFKKD
jgi:hypothetical protein